MSDKRHLNGLDGSRGADEYSAMETLAVLAESAGRSSATAAAATSSTTSSSATVPIPNTPNPPTIFTTSHTPSSVSVSGFPSGLTPGGAAGPFPGFALNSPMGAYTPGYYSVSSVGTPFANAFFDAGRMQPDTTGKKSPFPLGAHAGAAPAATAAAAAAAAVTAMEGQQQGSAKGTGEGKKGKRRASRQDVVASPAPAQGARQIVTILKKEVNLADVTPETTIYSLCRAWIASDPEGKLPPPKRLSSALAGFSLPQPLSSMTPWVHPMPAPRTLAETRSNVDKALGAQELSGEVKDGAVPGVTPITNIAKAGMIEAWKHQRRALYAAKNEYQGRRFAHSFAILKQDNAAVQVHTTSAHARHAYDTLHNALYTHGHGHGENGHADDGEGGMMAGNGVDAATDDAHMRGEHEGEEAGGDDGVVGMQMDRAMPAAPRAYPQHPLAQVQSAGMASNKAAIITPGTATSSMVFTTRYLTK